MAWYAPAVNKTFFCYGGTDEGKITPYMISYYDHKTGRGQAVSARQKPTCA